MKPVKIRAKDLPPYPETLEHLASVYQAALPFTKGRQQLPAGVLVAFAEAPIASVAAGIPYDESAFDIGEILTIGYSTRSRRTGG